MKKITSIFLVLVLTASALWGQMPPGMPARPGPRSTPQPAPQNNAPSAPSVTADNTDNEIIPPGLIDFQGVDVSQVLEVYAQLVGRTLLRAGLPQAQIVLKTETPLTKAEAIQALQAVLALNGIAVVNVGDKFVKVLPTEQAGTAAEPFSTANPNQLPELGSYVTRIVQLKYVKPSLMVPIIQPFSKAPNAILPIDDNMILVLRDYSENVKRMMELIEQIDVVVPAEYTSEVIPIKYAMADDIASVLSSLESPGGGTTSFGSATTPGNTGARNGIVGNNTQGGFGGMSGGSTPSYGQNGTIQQNNQGSTGGGQSPFANRLQNILNRVNGGGAGGRGGAGGMGQQPIQILGQTKIIADERSNSLLVYATKEDMITIKHIVSELDVLLAQVLIESVIMEVDLNKGWQYGISVAQQPQTYGYNGSQGAGAINNGTPFLNFANQISNTNSFPGNFTSTALSGLSYFANIGGGWDVALQAAANDSSTHIIQRPRIQTSQAKEAQFFVGQSVPYVTTTYEPGNGYAGGSSYSQLQVGISLDVTPFINPDGLVVMDINQQINDISGFTTISGVGQVPNTDNRTFTSEVAVKDRDTIILGGFTDTEADKSSTGVPILQDIPVLGWLFKSPTSTKTRQELLVMMRPTVLKTPELAALQAVKEEARSPGINGAEREERSVVKQEQKNEANEQKLIEPSKDTDSMFITNQISPVSPQQTAP